MNQEKVKQLLSESIAKVVFTKVNGEIREMLCTTSADIVPADAVEKTPTKPRAVNENIIRAYDVENSGWRSFRIDSIMTVDDEAFVN